MAKKTYIVTHPKLYLKAEGGKLAQASKGTEVTLEEKDAKSLLAKNRLKLKTGVKKDVKVESESASEKKKADKK